MNDWIEAAKAVIEWWRHTDPSDLPIEQLIAAVERAEKQEAVGYKKLHTWYQEHWESMAHKSRAWLSWEVWKAAQQAERARIRDIIKAVGVQGEHDKWFDACDAIMEKIDATE